MCGSRRCRHGSREFGLSPALGPVGYATRSTFLGGNEAVHRSWAEETQRVIDTEVARLLREAEERAVDLLTRHREELETLTAMLLELETVDRATVHELVGRAVPDGTVSEQPAPVPVAASGSSAAR